MAAFVFNIALGRVAELYRRVKGNDPANSTLLLVAINAGGATDATMQDYDTLAALLADAQVAEVTNSGYARLVLTDADLAAVPAPDDTNNRIELSLPARTWSAIAAGTGWTDIVVCYRPDTASTDADIVPMTLFDLVKTPDGGDIPLAAGGFYRGNAVAA
jgi:hypothetical protein